MSGVGLPADPNVKMPAAVKRTMDRTQQLVDAEAARKNGGISPPDQTGAPTPPPTPTPSLAPPSPSQPTPTPAPTPAPPAPVTLDSNDAENRFKAMQGRYNKAAQTAEALAARNAELERLMAMMASGPAPAAIPPAQNGAARGDVTFGKRLITPEEENAYGAEMIDVIGRRAQEIVDQQLGPLQQELLTLRRQVGGVAQTVTMDARQKLHADLDVQLPNWQQINENPDFISWLGLPDPYSGAIRMDLMQQAYARNQTGRVLAFFRGFLADEAATSPVGSGQPPGAPPAPAVDLNSLAAPGRARQGASPNLPPEKPHFTRAQITAFYRNVNAGAYAGRDAERQATEIAIFEAGRDGRVIG